MCNIPGKSSKMCVYHATYLLVVKFIIFFSKKMTLFPDATLIAGTRPNRNLNVTGVNTYFAAMKGYLIGPWADRERTDSMNGAFEIHLLNYFTSEDLGQYT